MRWAEVLTLKQYQGGPGQKPQNREAMTALKEHYDEAQIVEISMVAGFFNFWNRFTDAIADRHRRRSDDESDPEIHASRSGRLCRVHARLLVESRRPISIYM